MLLNIIILQTLTFIISFSIIDNIYEHSMSDSFIRSSIRLFNLRRGQTFPSDEKLWSLKFSLIRHFILSVVSFLFVTLADFMWLSVIVLLANAVYLFPAVNTYRYRIKQFGSSNTDLQSLVSPAMNACTIQFAHNITVFLFAFMGLILFKL